MFNFKKIIALTLIIATIMSLSIIANETENITNILSDLDYAPVIGEFIKDEEMAAMIKEKERLADLYYEAKTSNNYDLANKYLQQSNSLSLSQSKYIKASSNRLSIFQCPQETNYWCGYAAMQSLLDYECVEKTQKKIAELVYTPQKSCPWYLSNGNDRSQFPVAVNLTKLIGFYYAPYPYGTAGSTDIKSKNIKSKVTHTIDEEHGLMCCGSSRGDISRKHESVLPNYPAKKITHWVAIDGYKNNGDNIYIVDPAKSDKVSFSDNIREYYSVSADKLAAFAKARGLIW